MMLPRPLLIAVYLAGRSWTAWVVGALLIVAMQVKGAGGFDAVILAIGPSLVWMGISWCCRAFTRYAGSPFERSVLPANKPLPTPQLAVVVVLEDQSRTDPAPAQMIARLPNELRRLLTCEQIR